MYKVNQQHLPRSATLAYNNRGKVSSRPDFHDYRALDQYMFKGNDMRMQKSSPAVNKKAKTKEVTEERTRTANYESLLQDAWTKFVHKPDGRPDDSIVIYKPTKDLPEDFVPCSIEQLLAKRILKSVNLDPEIANGVQWRESK